MTEEIHDEVVTVTCVECGHAEEQHAPTGFHKPCEVDGCDCEDWEPLS